jgi:hypothetical protein
MSSGLLLDALREPSPMEKDSLVRRTFRQGNSEIIKPEVSIRYESHWGSGKWKWNSYANGKFLCSDPALDKLLANLVTRNLMSAQNAADLLDNISGKKLYE